MRSIAAARVLGGKRTENVSNFSSLKNSGGRALKHFLLAALLIAALPISTPLSGQVDTSDFRTNEQEVKSVIDRWVQAEIHHDRAALEDIISPDALFTYQSGETGGRDDFIEMILDANIPDYSVNHEQVLIFGDTAVSISTGLGTKFTTVLVRRDGQWLVISETFSKDPASQ